jgi:release factor glutamine methyltransferase
MTMAEPSLPDRLGRTREERGDQVLYRFANGLAIRTERFGKPDTLRILPLGSPQGALMNHLANFPARVCDRRVLEPFAGSGALGLMALALGARHVDFVDINPRAAEFQRANAELCKLDPARFASVTGDLADFAPARRYDLIVANPPFVPTPDGIVGTITSNGGPDGSRFADMLFGRLDELLEPEGEALVYLLELVRHGQPLAAERLCTQLEHRPVELTPAQAEPTPLAAYRRAYTTLFPDATDAVARWAGGLADRHGPELAVCHYIADVGPRTAAATSCVVREDFAQKFGAAWLVPSQAQDSLAAVRVLENVIPPG